jgi:hypothetical protein
MPDTPVKRTVDEVRADLEGFLSDLDVEEVEAYDEKDSWGFTMKFGSYPLLIDNEKGVSYCVVVFQVTVPGGDPTSKLNELYARDDFKFQYQLFGAFSSPVTGFSRIFEGDKVVGFTVSKYIYPFHPGFSIRHLDAALQAVVSAGAQGVMFLKSLLGEWEETEKVAKELGQSEPGPMYE